VAVAVRFSASHLWVKAEGADAVIGISEYLQDQIGEITALALPDVGDVISINRRIGKVESEDVSSPIEAPISGEVLDVNTEALENPELVNSDPYAAGWLLRVRMDDPNELEDLIGEEEYAELTTEV
jgi:glycine cleavage system H protein